jgi:phosphohistidine phosphatase
MKTLYLCRHAKSSWADPGMADHERPLNERGRMDAPVMAAILDQRREGIELFVSSPATRALTTALIFVKAQGLDEKVLRLEPKIYEASTQALANVVAGLPAGVRKAMLFGHNPGFTDLIEWLTSEDIGNLPTCGMARIDLEVDEWAAVGRGTGSLAWLDYPKMHTKG